MLPPSEQFWFISEIKAENPDLEDSLSSRILSLLFVVSLFEKVSESSPFFNKSILIFTWPLVFYSWPTNLLFWFIHLHVENYDKKNLRIYSSASDSELSASASSIP